MPRIAVALQNDFADWEPALLMAAARYYLDCEVLTASPDGAPVVSMGGMKVTPDLGFDAIGPERFDALVVPGGYAWEKGVAFDFTEMARAFRDEGKVLAGICAAASALAATGVLNDGPYRQFARLAPAPSRLSRRGALSRPAAGGPRRDHRHRRRLGAGHVRGGGAEGAGSVDPGSRGGALRLFGGAPGGGLRLIITWESPSSPCRDLLPVLTGRRKMEAPTVPRVPSPRMRGEGGGSRMRGIHLRQGKPPPKISLTLAGGGGRRGW
ncbi:DJ-1/PfpI family protein [Pseudomonas sp. R2.Fl]|nr:DJ-1/PfpI family protein [Pseudomonas sp. R2.Fl]